MKQQTWVHALALTAGVLSIVDGSAAVLGLPSYVVGVLGVAIAVLFYCGNQLDALGTGSTGSTSIVVSAPTAPATAPVAILQPIAPVAAQEPPAPPA